MQYRKLHVIKWVEFRFENGKSMRNGIYAVYRFGFGTNIEKPSKRDAHAPIRTQVAYRPSRVKYTDLPEGFFRSAACA